MLVLVVSIIVLFAGYVFLYKDIVKKNTANAELLNYISSESNREAYASSARKQLQNLESDIKKARSSVVDSGGVVSFIEKVESIARNNNLTISNDNISDEVDPKQASSTLAFLKIRSSTKGSWFGIYRFMSELESMPYKVKINSFSLSNSRDSGLGEGINLGPSLWTADFEIRVLKYK